MLGFGGSKASWVLTPATVVGGVLARERDARVVASEGFGANTALLLVRRDVIGGPLFSSQRVLESLEGIVHAVLVGRVDGRLADGRSGLCRVSGDHRCGINVGGNVFGDILGTKWKEPEMLV